MKMRLSRFTQSWLSTNGILVICALMPISCENADPPSSLDIGVSQQSIRGGSESWLASAVAIRTSQCANNANSIPLHCSGLLISPTTVLTAAHCVKYDADSGHPNGVDPNQWQTFQVAVGCHNITTPSSCTNWVGLAANGIEMYSTGSDYLLYDIAVLHLASSTTIKPTRLMAPSRMAELSVGNTLTPYGWGTTESNQLSPVLKSLELQISTIEEHTLSYPYSDSAGTDHGDSGGPGMVVRDNESFVTSVNSTRTGGTLVPYYFEWVSAHTVDLPPQSFLPASQIVLL